MKLHHWFEIACALVALGASGARADQAAFAAQVKATAGLLGYWSFEGNYEDQSGKGNHAEAFGEPTLIQFCEGVKGGQGVELNNEPDAGQYLAVTAPIGSIFDTPHQTVLVWAKSTGAPNIDEYENILDRASLWYIDTLYVEVDGEPKLDLVARIYTPSTPAGGGSGMVRSSQAGIPVYINPNEWALFGWTYDGEVMTIYVNGLPVRQVNYAGGLGPNAETPEEAPTGNWDIFWGAWRGESDHMHGCVDDTVIFDRALSPEEVKALFDAMMKEPAPAP